LRKVVQKLAKRWCRAQIARTLPGVVEEVAAYAARSNTTGTQWITLWMAVRGILKHRPEWILEAGTGSSTLVLAAAVQKLRREVPGYQGRIVSMESVREWLELAEANLPDKYRDVVEIRLGPRERFDMAMFRGYCHSNIPAHDYSFVLLDGPSFTDEHGIAFCADVFRVMQLSQAPVIHGVSDGRASSVMVIQQLYGTGAARYWHGLYAAQFSLPRIDWRDGNLNTPRDFRCSPFGRLQFVKFRKRG
jgi:hypothetical protein